MALDEPGKNDEVFHCDGITYVIEKELFEQVKPIRVDFTATYMGSGFTIDSNISQVDSAPSSCSCG